MKRLLTFSLVVLCVFLYVRCSEGASPAQGHIALGGVYYQAGEYDEAIAEFKKAISINPNNESAYNGLGGVYHQAGEYDEAIAEFKKAISVNPNSLRAYNGLGLVYSEQGKYDLAVRFYQKLTQRMQWFITTWGMSTRRNSSVT